MKKIEMNITRYNSKTGFYVEVNRSEGIKDWKSFYIGHRDYSIKIEMIGCEVKDRDVNNFILDNLWDWISFYIQEVIESTRFFEDIEETQEEN